MRTASLLLALVAAAAPALAADPEPAPPPPPPRDDHPLFTSGDEEWMELRGGIEAGFRAVSGRDGRYAQDVNLDPGFRLLDAEIRGTALEKGLWADSFSLGVHGLGDPDRLGSFTMRADDAYDLRIHSDREEYVFRATADPHPFDTMRLSDGARLSFHVLKNLEFHVSEERLQRFGSADLDQMYAGTQHFPVAATLDYDGRTFAAGFDGTSGDFRFGANWTRGRAEDDAVRLLDRPDTPIRDLGRYLNLSAIGTEAGTGRAGLRLFRGRVDLDVTGTWSAAQTDSVVRQNEAVSTPAAPGSKFTDVMGRTESNARGKSARADLLWTPRPEWELLGRWESSTRDQVGSGFEQVRVQNPPFDPNAPFLPVPLATRASADLVRTGLEARWRPEPQWRFRAGAEQVRETIRETESVARTWAPVTTAATQGIEWNPSTRFDGSLLLREAWARRPATHLSTDEGDWLSLRIRLKRPDGFHGTLFARIKRRSNDGADAFTTYDSYGYAFGHGDAKGWFEISVTREDFTLQSNTRFVYDASVDPLKELHTVRFDETVTAATLDFSQVVTGPLRTFGTVRWAGGSGGAPYVQSDASLGLGWRVVKSTEVRLEARRVAYDQGSRGVDDYAARILTLSFLYEF